MSLENLEATLQKHQSKKKTKLQSFATPPRKIFSNSDIRGISNCPLEWHIPRMHNTPLLAHQTAHREYIPLLTSAKSFVNLFLTYKLYDFVRHVMNIV